MEAMSTKIALGMGVAAGIFIAYRAQAKAVGEENDGSDRSEEVVKSLRALQNTLHLLTPAQQSEVKKELPFATGEWLDGLALATRSQELSIAKELSSGSTTSRNPTPLIERAGSAIHRSLSLGSALDERESETETGNAARIRLSESAGPDPTSSLVLSPAQ